MSQPLDYAIPAERRPTGALRMTANLLFAYPLCVLTCLYIVWLLAWMMLGHQPRPSIDDPSTVPGLGLLCLCTALLLLGYPAAGMTALLINIWHLFESSRSPSNAIKRLGLLITLWIGVAIILELDPGSVLVWLFD